MWGHCRDMRYYEPFGLYLTKARAVFVFSAQTFCCSAKVSFFFFFSTILLVALIIPACTGAVCSFMLSGSNENQNVPIWGCDFLLENGLLSLSFGWELLPQTKGFNYLGILLMSGMKWTAVLVHQKCIVQDPCSNKNNRMKGKALDLPVDLYSNPHLESLAFSSGTENEIVNTNGQKFPP